MELKNCVNWGVIIVVNVGVFDWFFKWYFCWISENVKDGYVKDNLKFCL